MALFCMDMANLATYFSDLVNDSWSVGTDFCQNGIHFGMQQNCFACKTNGVYSITIH